MKYAKLFVITLFIFSLLSGCGSNDADPTEPPMTDIKLDNNYVIVISSDADDTTKQSAICLQASLDAKLRLKNLEIVTKDPGQKAIVLTVDSTFDAGKYEFRTQDTSLYITAGNSHTLLYAVKQLRQAMLENGKEPRVTAEMCTSLTGSVNYDNLPFTFVSQNILFKNIEGGNTVTERAPRFQKLISEYQPDILAIQENSADWVYYCKNYFGKTYYSVNTDGCTFLLRTDRYELVSTKYFYMSPTPNIKSQFEGDSGPRSGCWAIVKDLITGKEFYLSNAHLDWNNDTQRALQLEVLIEITTPYMEQYPTIACGDYNSTPDGPIYARACEVLTDARLSAEQNHSTINFTCHSFGESMKLIDYIFHNSGFEAKTYYIMSDMYGGYVSDHYGVLTEFTFAE